MLKESDTTNLLKDYPIHVGFGKCGSTFLQQYFRDHPQIEMVRRPKARNLLVVTNDLAYDPTEARVYFAEFARAARERGKRAVYSSERLVGNVLTGHYDMQAIALRLKQVFEGPRIFLMVRNQMTLIASIYRQYLRMGGAKTFQQFITPGDGRIPVFDWRAYEFHRLVEFHRMMFGSENVFVFALEQLVHDSEDILRRVCAMCGVPYEPPTSLAPRNVGFDASRLESAPDERVVPPKMPNLQDTETLSRGAEASCTPLPNGWRQRDCSATAGVT